MENDDWETHWGTGLLLLIDVLLLAGLAEVDVVTLDPLTGGTPMLSFGPVINWGLFRARGAAIAVTRFVLVMKVLLPVVLVEETVVEEIVVVVAVEVEVLVAGDGTAWLLVAVIVGHLPALILQLPCAFEDAIRVMSAYEACGVDPLDVEV